MDHHLSLCDLKGTAQFNVWGRGLRLIKLVFSEENIYRYDLRRIWKGSNIYNII